MSPAPLPPSDGPYWRSPQPLHGTHDPRRGEFPVGADLPPQMIDRRSLLQLAGAGMALAGLGGCVGPGDQELIPYARQPEEVVPGVPRFFATAMEEEGYATGLVVETHEGRPTKIEGNPDHPASLGACSPFAQASILQLYDPDRANAIRRRTMPATYDQVVAALRAGLVDKGVGMAILLEPTAAPQMEELLARLRAVAPGLRCYLHAAHSGGRSAGLQQVFAQRLLPQMSLDQARVVVALDADVLASGPFHLRHARDFAQERRQRAPGQRMNRLYVAESTPSCTGGLADHRLAIGDAQITAAALVLLEAIATRQAQTLPLPPSPWAALSFEPHQLGWLQAAAEDLWQEPGAGIVVAGERQPPVVHAVVAAINQVLGNHGRTLRYVPDPLLAADGDLYALCADLDRGAIATLLVLGGNPVYTAPADLDPAVSFAKARTSAALTLYENETAACCEWTIPAAHYLESWGDARAADGSVSLQQPMIRPLTGGRTPADLLADLLGDPRSARQRLHERWGDGPALGAQPGDATIATDAAMVAILRRGLIAGSAAAPVLPRYNWSALAGLLPSAPPGAEPYELSLRLDAKVHDGRFANNPWLQELPDPISKLTWDNAALMSSAMAASLGISDGDVVELGVEDRRIELPALVLPGQAASTLTVHLGYGRRGGEQIAAGVGVNAYALRSRGRPWGGDRLRVRKTGQRQALAITQEHWHLESRPIVRERTWREYQEQPQFPPAPARASLRAPVPQEGHQWALAIDMSVCLGCNACVVACQAENNIPVVGKENVLLGREMHWLRIDRYYRGDPQDPTIISQPMMCQHCEKAPCEYVCPTYATTHSPDGINEMTYNRCVGTRFCSNNCPYKVRRFNWYNFNDNQAAVTTLVHNPNVTVRARGVMEKCTSCIQRIRAADIAEHIGGGPQARPQVQTACQQTCPTQAIIFGDMQDGASAVARARANPLAYAVLEETGAEPRTRYLAQLRNPNPRLP